MLLNYNFTVKLLNKERTKQYYNFTNKLLNKERTKQYYNFTNKLSNQIYIKFPISCNIKECYFIPCSAYIIQGEKDIFPFNTMEN